MAKHVFSLGEYPMCIGEQLCIQLCKDEKTNSCLLSHSFLLFLQTCISLLSLKLFDLSRSGRAMLRSSTLLCCY